MDDKLWSEFNLAKSNQDPGAGILYCLRYDANRLKGHQEQVVTALKSLGIKLDDLGDNNIVASFIEPNSIVEKGERAYLLLEELSCLNEAIEYTEVGFGKFKSIEELKHGLITTYFSLLTDEKKVEAYDLISTVIPQIVRDIRIADSQNKALSNKEKKALEELILFTKRKEALASGKYVLFG